MKNGVVKSVYVNCFQLKTKAPDNMCCINNEIYLINTHIHQNGNFKGKKFLNLINFFEYPTKTLDSIYTKNTN